MDLGINKRMLTSHSEIKHLPTQALAEQETGAFLHLHTPSRHRLRLLSLHGKNYTRKCVPHRPVGSQLTSLVTNRWRGKPGCYLREDPPYGNIRSREQEFPPTTTHTFWAWTSQHHHFPQHPRPQMLSPRLWRLNVADATTHTDSR